MSETSAVLSFCPKCGRPIGTAAIWFGGSKFHPECGPAATLNTPLMEERIARKEAVNAAALIRMELEEAATDRDRYKRERDLALRENERMREALELAKPILGRSDEGSAGFLAYDAVCSTLEDKP